MRAKVFKHNQYQYSIMHEKEASQSYQFSTKLVYATWFCGDLMRFFTSIDRFACCSTWANSRPNAVNLRHRSFRYYPHLCQNRERRWVNFRGYSKPHTTSNRFNQGTPESIPLWLSVSCHQYWWNSSLNISVQLWPIPWCNITSQYPGGNSSERYCTSFLKLLTDVDKNGAQVTRSPLVTLAKNMKLLSSASCTRKRSLQLAYVRAKSVI